MECIVKIELPNGERRSVTCAWNSAYGCVSRKSWQQLQAAYPGYTLLDITPLYTPDYWD